MSNVNRTGTKGFTRVLFEGMREGARPTREIGSVRAGSHAEIPTNFERARATTRPTRIPITKTTAATTP
jgi:hypothetical protein